MTASAGRCRNHVVERTVEDVGHKRIQSVANVDEQANVQAEFDEVLERAHTCLPHDLVGSLEQARQVDGVDALGEFVAGLRCRVGLEGHPVPRGVVGAVTELPQFGGGDEHGGGRRAVKRQRLDRAARQACRGCGWLGQQGQARQLLEGIQNGHTQHVIVFCQRIPVVEQNLAQTGERIVDLGHIGTRRPLITQDAGNEVFAQRAGRGAQPAESGLIDSLANGVGACTARSHHQHALPGGGERPERVDHGLGAARARQRFHDDAVSRGDVRHHFFLLGVGIQHKGVRRRRTSVLRGGVRRNQRRNQTVAR